MVTKLSHATIWVFDQDVAYDFYVNKLGFDVRTDHTMDNGFRWLTVGPKTQPDLEIVLMPVGPGPALSEEQAQILGDLVKAGCLGAGVFECDDCDSTYADLVAKGVEFKTEPTQQFYGKEAIMKDPFGNWFSMTSH
ncbi:MAG: VOC family protein [Fimbriimonadaceae bacterium]|nr:MAG: VOC family protein [Fimbriimonadaceae bacterium]